MKDMITKVMIVQGLVMLVMSAIIGIGFYLGF